MKRVRALFLLIAIAGLGGAMVAVSAAQAFPGVPMESRLVTTEAETVSFWGRPYPYGYTWGPPYTYGYAQRRVYRHTYSRWRRASICHCRG